MRIIKRTAPVVLASVALLAAGCGGTSPTSTSGTTAGAGGSAPKDGIQAAYKFSACMRNHGVTNFPDPVVHTSGNSTAVGIRIDPAITGSPAFKTAQKACQSILPPPSKSDLAAQAAQQRQHGQDLLSFARCLRGHGVTDFPDPNAQGRLSLAMVQAAGVDLHAPSVISAARTCVPASNGAITQAAVSQATGSGSSQSSGSGSSQSTGSGQ